VIARWIGWLVGRFPREFRERWGAETIESSRAMVARGRKRGWPAQIRLFLRISLDLASGAVAERLAERRSTAPERRRIAFEERRTTMLDGLAFDLRDAWRGIRRSPLHAAGVVLTLALGIGANAAIFAVVYHVVLEPLPYADPDRLVLLWEKNPERGWHQAQIAPANFLDWRERATVFESVVGFSDWTDSQILSAPGEPAGVEAMFVAGDLFGVLGVPLPLGRSFGRDEFWRADAGVVVLSDRLWKRRFGAEPGVIGRQIVVDGDSLTVVGVAPPEFEFYLAETDLWRPFGLDPEAREQVWFRQAHIIRAVARLAPGATAENASAELATIAADLERRHPETNSRMGAGASLYSRWLTGDARRPLGLAFVAVAMVLVVTCANVAHLLLARATEREQEQAVRGCLGASRWRLVRRAVAEQSLLGLTGGTAGLLLARLGLPPLLEMGGSGLPRLDAVRVGGIVFGFTLALALVAALGSGIAPALRDRRSSLEERLRHAGRGGVSRRQVRIRQALLAAEVTFAVVVVAGAALVVRSFVALVRVDAGFDPENVVTAQISLPADRYPGRREIGAFAARLVDRVRAIPGVESAGLVRGLPTTSQGWTSDFAVAGRGREEFGVGVRHREVSEGYFETLRVPLLAGRLIDSGDVTDSTSVALVNRTLAERYFPEGDAIGRRISFDRYPDGSSIWHEIVGVVGDERQGSPATPPAPEIFKPLAQESTRAPFLAVRSDLPAAAVVPELRRALSEIDRDLPLLAPRTMTDVYADSVAREQFLLVLFALFAALALLLSALGVYAVAAHSAAARRREVGLRIALGAEPATVVRGLVGRGLRPVALGLAGGVSGGLALGRAMSGLLYGVAPHDVASLVSAPALLFVAAAIANLLPARRASRVAPAEVLRAE
jgi:predicted permease